MRPRYRYHSTRALPRLATRTLLYSTLSVRIGTRPPQSYSIASLGKSFPVPHEGVNESEGVVVFEAILPEPSGEHRLGFHRIFNQ